MAANFPVIQSPEIDAHESEVGVSTQNIADSTFEAPPYSPLTEASERMQFESSESHTSPNFIGSSSSASNSNFTAFHFFNLVFIRAGFLGPRKEEPNSNYINLKP